MSSSSIWIDVAVAVLAVALTAVLGLFVLFRLRARRASLKGQLSDSPVFAQDRAHNQIQLARSEIRVLAAEGYDVHRPEELVRSAERELARGQNVDAVRSALAAHRLLLELRQQGGPGPIAPTGPARAGRPASATGSPRPATLDPGGPPVTAPPATEERRAPPKNRMEAHFQMTLLVEEIHRQNTPTEATRAAESLRSSAQEAYGRGEYTEALRFALKGRRSLGAVLETLPAVPSRAAPAPSPAVSPAAPPAGGDSVHPGTCRKCGRAARPMDTFCRGCGASLGGGRCARCGAERLDSDTYCGRCGAPADQ